MGIETEDKNKGDEWSEERRAKHEKEMEEGIAKMKERKKLVEEIKAKLDYFANSQTSPSEDETIEFFKRILDEFPDN